MKITDIQVYSVEAVRRNWTFIEVETDADITGIGEITLEMFDAGVAAAVQDYKRILIGENPLEVERLYDHMTRNKFWRTDTLSTTVLSGIDIALWDLKAKSIDMPLYKLLGGSVREKVVCYPHTQGSSNKELIENSKKAVDEGWKFVRWGQPETHGIFEQGDLSQESPGRLEPIESVKIF